VPVRRLVLVLPLIFLSAPSYAAGPGDPIVPVAFALAIILAAAKVFGHFAEVLGLPAVLGELIAGIVRREAPNWLCSQASASCFCSSKWAWSPRCPRCLRWDGPLCGWPWPG
jgi:hypothetical protein